jgi:RNA polymerase subunit RPABC4/transcription elongation factor Spt4
LWLKWSITYAARWWFSITIPTNIVQYMWMTLDNEMVWWVQCFLATVIAQYQRTGNREQTPSIRHLVCKNNPSLIPELQKEFFVHEFADKWQIHLIQILEPERYDIAQWITINYPNQSE